MHSIILTRKRVWLPDCIVVEKALLPLIILRNGLISMCLHSGPATPQHPLKFGASSSGHYP